MSNPAHKIELKNNKTMDVGDLARIDDHTGAHLQGWFKYEYRYSNGDLAFYGPVNDEGTNLPHSRFRAFKPDQVRMAKKPGMKRASSVKQNSEESLDVVQR